MSCYVSLFLWKIIIIRRIFFWWVGLGFGGSDETWHLGT